MVSLKNKGKKIVCGVFSLGGPCLGLLVREYFIEPNFFLDI